MSKQEALSLIDEDRDEVQFMTAWRSHAITGEPEYNGLMIQIVNQNPDIVKGWSIVQLSDEQVVELAQWLYQHLQERIDARTS